MEFRRVLFRSPTGGLRRFRKGKAADIKGQRPAIAVGKVFETRHRRALKALRNHLIEREQATLARARRVRESTRWRIEPRGPRAVSGPGRAMAHETIFRDKLRPERHHGTIGRGTRGEGCER